MRAVDLFAGAGGGTVGALQAGVDVVYAANHWQVAVDCHARNHPGVAHECQDLRQADFTALPEHDGLIAGPACQGHSEASQPKRRAKHDADRATAWAVVDCADACTPAWLVVENVPAFRRWRLYPVWRQALEALGYAVQEHVLVAADFGVPQTRKRLFVTGVLSGRPVEIRPTVDRWVPAETILDPNEDGWEPVASKSEAVQARVAKGRRNHGRRFFTQHVTGHPGRGMGEPLATVTCAPGHWCLVDGDMMRPLSVRELARAHGFGDGYWLPEDNQKVGTRLVGNAIPPPMAAAVVGAVAAVA